MLCVLPCVLSAQERRIHPDGGRPLPTAVQTTARVKGAVPSPVYPETLRAAHVEGEALLRYLVNPAGEVNTDSIRVVAATHPLFAAAARTALLNRNYSPALQDGRPAGQWIQERFLFRLPSKPSEREAPPT
ncbi:MAG: energy transducer TonB [Gemmatimonadaceae bacterium]